MTLVQLFAQLQTLICRNLLGPHESGKSLLTVKELPQAVKQMGILSEQPLVLYTQPRSIHIHQSSAYRSDWCNCLVDTVEQLFRAVGPEIRKVTRRARFWTIVLASETCHACVMIEDKMQGWSGFAWGNHCARITIWAPADVTRQIVERLVQAQNGDPIGSGIDWSKIEKAWKIRRVDAIARWRTLLADTGLPDTKPPSELVLAAMAGDSSVRFCSKCGATNSEFALFCAGCGESMSERG